MIDKIAGLVNADSRLVRRGRFVDTTFMIAIDDAYTLLRIQEGRVTKVARPFHHGRLQFLPARLTQRLGKILATACPTRLHRHIRARETETHAGGRQPASLHGEPALFQGCDRGSAAGGEAMSSHFEPIAGRYLNLELLGKPHRLYARKQAKEFRCSACILPVPTRASIAACSTTRA